MRRMLAVACAEDIVPNAMTVIFLRVQRRDDRHCGSEGGPVILPVFKTGEWQVRPVTGAFDSHTLPPKSLRSPMIARSKIFAQG